MEEHQSPFICYYKLDNKLYFKYDTTTYRFYLLNKSGEWVECEELQDIFYSSDIDHDYEEASYSEVAAEVFRIQCMTAPMNGYHQDFEDDLPSTPDKLEVNEMYLNNDKTASELHRLCVVCSENLEVILTMLYDLRSCFEEYHVSLSYSFGGRREMQEQSLKYCVNLLDNNCAQIKYLCESMHKYMSYCMEPVDSISAHNLRLAEAERLILDLSELFPVTELLTICNNLLYDCYEDQFPAEIAGIYTKKIDQLRVQLGTWYADRCLPSTKELKIALEAYKIESTNFIIQCVYASPFMRKDEFLIPEKEEIYPFIHSTQEEEHDVSMNCVYASLEQMGNKFI